MCACTNSYVVSSKVVQYIYFFNSANIFRFWVCTLGSRKEMSVTLAFLRNLHKPSRDSSGIRQFRKKKTVQVLVYGLDFFVVVVVVSVFYVQKAQNSLTSTSTGHIPANYWL